MLSGLLGRLLGIVGVAVGALILLGTAPTRAWPDRPVRLQTPFGAGGGSDAIARIVADRLSKRWNQPVIVENKPGADGFLAVSDFLQTRDPHFLLFGFTSLVTVNPLMHQKMPYSVADLLPVSSVVDAVMTVVTNPATNLNSLADLVAAAKAKPGALNFATVPGGGHFGFVDFQRREGISLVLVPYRNPIASVADLIENRIQVAVMPLSIVLSQAKAGKLKLLCVAYDRRAPAVPEVQTTAEAGAPYFRVLGGLGVFGGPDIALELREKIARDVAEVLGDRDVSDRIIALGEIPRSTTPNEFAALLAEQGKWYLEMAVANGIKPQP